MIVKHCGYWLTRETNAPNLFLRDLELFHLILLKLDKFIHKEQLQIEIFIQAKSFYHFFFFFFIILCYQKLSHMVAEEEKFPFQGSLCNSNKKVLSMIVSSSFKEKRLKYRHRNGYFFILRKTLKFNQS